MGAVIGVLVLVYAVGAAIISGLFIAGVFIVACALYGVIYLLAFALTGARVRLEREHVGAVICVGGLVCLAATRWSTQTEFRLKYIGAALLSFAIGFYLVEDVGIDSRGAREGSKLLDLSRPFDAGFVTGAVFWATFYLVLELASPDWTPFFLGDGAEAFLNGLVLIASLFVSGGAVAPIAFNHVQQQQIRKSMASIHQHLGSKTL